MMSRSSMLTRWRQSSLCKSLLIIVAISGHYSVATAQIAWEATEKILSPSPGQARTIAIFKFQNTGEVAVDILELKKSCQCLAAIAGKASYAPSETGEIVMTLDRNGRTANQAESVRVLTSDGKTAVLTLKIEGAKFLKVKPPFVIWKRGEALTPKEFTVEITDDKAEVTALSVTSTDAVFEVSVAPEVKGKRYVVRVTPKSTQIARTSTFTLEADYPKEQPGRILAYGKVL